MSRKVRLAILIGCIALFVLVSPYLVLYSLGYRVNLAKATVSTTGGVYVRAWPSPNTVTVDGRTAPPTSFFANDAFVQNLSPGLHQVRIVKNGYVTYQKPLPVVGGQVAKLEKTVLFKQHPLFNQVTETATWFSFSPDGSELIEETGASRNTVSFAVLATASGRQKTFSAALRQHAVSQVRWSSDSRQALLELGAAWFLVDLSAAQPLALPQPRLAGAADVSFIPGIPPGATYLKNGSLFLGNAAVPAATKVMAFTVRGGDAYYLDSSGWLYHISPQANQAPVRMNRIQLPADPRASYRLFAVGNTVLVQKNNALLKLGSASGGFEPFEPSVLGGIPSPDNTRLLSWNAHEAFFARLDTGHQTAVSLGVFPDAIENCFWLNNDYAAVQTANGITISETDARGSVNAFTLPSSLTLQDGSNIPVKNPQAAFSAAAKSLYILNDGRLYASERLLP